MTPLTWALAGWLGALAYVMVGALVYRVMKTNDDELRFDRSVGWPIYLAGLIVYALGYALVYIPFRAAARAIAKPREEA